MNNTQLVRVEGLKKAVIFFGGLNEENRVQSENMIENAEQLKLKINEMKSVLEEKRRFVEEMKELENYLDNYEDYLDHIENNLPNQLSEVMENLNLYVEEIPHHQVKQTPLPRNELKSSTASTTAVPNIIITGPNNEKNGCTKGFTGLDYISVQGFNKVHKYMRGRLTLESVNAFIDTFNSVIKRKYDILKQPKNKLKNNEPELYNKWKSLEKSANITPGTHFCTANDFMTLENIKLDKSSFNKLVILRHTKLIKEVRCGSETLYVIL